MWRGPNCLQAAGQPWTEGCGDGMVGKVGGPGGRGALGPGGKRGPWAEGGQRPWATWPGPCARGAQAQAAGQRALALGFPQTGGPLPAETAVCSPPQSRPCRGQAGAGSEGRDPTTGLCEARLYTGENEDTGGGGAVQCG